MNYTVKLMKSLIDAMDLLGFEPANGACGYRGFKTKKERAHGFQFVNFEDACYALANIDSVRVRNWFSHVFRYRLNEHDQERIVNCFEYGNIRQILRLQLNRRKSGDRFIWVNTWEGKSHKIELSDLETVIKEIK
ncbi:MAG: hypothetical protein ACRCWQ_02130 [Bacilli bacterium]